MLLSMLRLCIQCPQMSVLKERMVALDALAQEEANLRCKECSNSSLREYYRGGLTVSAEFSTLVVTFSFPGFPTVELQAGCSAR